MGVLIAAAKVELLPQFASYGCVLEMNTSTSICLGKTGIMR